MNKRNHQKKLSHRILDLVILVLCVMLVGAGVFAVESFMESLSFSYETQSFYWRLEDDNYAQMVEMYHVNEAAGIEPDDEMNKYYGVARYFEAASFYKMHLEADQPEKANEHYLIMQEAKTQMGELSFESDKICEKLGIELP